MTRPALVALGLLCASLPLAARAEAHDRVAVLILGATAADVETADNLTEVVIARVAQAKGYEIVGTFEFRKRLGMEDEHRAHLCLQDPVCVGTAAVSLGVTRIVSGSVGARGTQYLFTLVLRNMQTGEVENQLFRLVDGGAEELVRAAQKATDGLFAPPSSPSQLRIGTEPPAARVWIDDVYLGTSPVISGTLVPGAHRLRVEKDGRFPWAKEIDVPAGARLEVHLTPENLPRRLRWPSFAAFGAAGVAAAAALTGAVMGTLAQAQPASSDRAMAQQQFDERRGLGLSADVAFVTAGVFGAVAGLLGWHYRDHIFGRN